jgi:hypothetical protein
MAESEEAAAGASEDAGQTTPSRDEVQKHIAAWLADKAPRLVCWVCNTSRWTVGELGEVRLYRGGAFIIGGGVYPIIPLVCENCGHMVAFNAVTTGLFPGAPAEETPSDPDTAGES